MTKLLPCSRCGSFLPTAARACPGCQRPIVRARRLPAPVRTLLAIGGGGLLSLTLSACYGAPCTGGACGPCDPSRDQDGDGYCGREDCDDTDPNVNLFCNDAGTDAGFTVDAGGPDAGETASDGGASDAGSSDAGETASDAGSSDAGETASDAGEASDGGATADAAL